VPAVAGVVVVDAPGAPTPPAAPVPVLVPGVGGAPGVLGQGSGGGGVVAGGATVAAAVVMVFVLTGGAGPVSPASLTRAAARTPSESTTTTTAATSGAFQLGDAARRVRAAAPQLRHHSCSGWSGLPHNGQASPPRVLAGGGGTVLSLAVPAGEDVAALTSRA